MKSEYKFWSIKSENIIVQLQSGKDGLSRNEREKRLKSYGANILNQKKDNRIMPLLISQFKSPIILILLGAVGLSFFLGETIDAVIILVIVLLSGFLGFWQEYSASNAVKELLSLVKIKVNVLINGKDSEVNIENVVPGDITILKAGDIIPGDCLIIESKSLFVDEAALTGETFPIEKEVGILPEKAELAKRTNSLWMGTHVISGSAKAIVVNTGRSTEFGKISERLRLKSLDTEFEYGVRHFGYFLMETTLTFVFIIFVINVAFNRPVINAFLFSLALAVGLTPQLLPAIISVNLAHGAKAMADNKVIVKRLASIENFGSMNILCSDKTGTLTIGKVKFHSAIDFDGNKNERVAFYAYLNAFYETGFVNPIDEAIRTYKTFDIGGYIKLDEEPYDFFRKRLSMLVSVPGKDKTSLMVTKGAFKNIVSVCTHVETAGGKIVKISKARDKLNKLYEEYSNSGYRIMGVAYKEIESITKMDKNNEKDMVFLGIVNLEDPPKQQISNTIKNLNGLGITLKIITGDNKLVAVNTMNQLGLKDQIILTGSEIHNISDQALPKRISNVSVFAEIEPNQKERIIIALKKSGNVVGYMGDGINDTPALHAADVSISVDSAVDVAKEAADIVLMEKDLNVLVNGVKFGRTTFSNTLKYVFMATSANFGNMFSMAGASLFLPFLPLLPKQILLTNLLTDFPEMTIATDSVDNEMVDKPRRWNVSFIRKFMITFGLLSSIFDYLTFGLLIFIVHAKYSQFRTAWFIESVISASLIVLVIRSRRPFFKSKPSRPLTIATLITTIITLLIPYSPLSNLLGFKPLAISLLLIIGLIIIGYILLAELVKKVFYKMIKF